MTNQPWRDKGVHPGSSNGAALLLGIVVVMILLALVLPQFVRLARHEVVQEVSRHGDSAALSLAEAALEKIQWRLANDDAFLLDALAGVIIPGYEGTTEHSDLSGGVYKVALSSGPGQGQIAALLKARRDDGACAAVRARFSQPSVTTSYLCPEFNHMYWQPGTQAATFSQMMFHWSPIKVNRVVISQWNWGVDFPRVYSKGSIILGGPNTTIPLDPVQVDQDPTPPNAVNNRWYSYTGKTYVAESGYRLDYGYYMGKAKASRFNGIPGLAAQADPPGSGYFPRAPLGGDTDIWDDFSFRSSTSVLFFDSWRVGSLYTGFVEVEAMLAIDGHFTFRGRPTAWVDTLLFQATVPANANLEYQYNTAPGVWNDGTLNDMESAWAKPNHCCYTIPHLNFRGLVGGKRTRVTFDYGAILGVIVADNGFGVHGEDSSGVGGNAPLYFERGGRLYFDEEVASRIHSLEKPTLDSWDRVNEPW
jgi:hypothetical protein